MCFIDGVQKRCKWRDEIATLNVLQACLGEKRRSGGILPYTYSLCLMRLKFILSTLYRVGLACPRLSILTAVHIKTTVRLLWGPD